MTSDPNSYQSLRKLAGQYPDTNRFMDLLLDLITERNDRAAVLSGVSLLDGALKAILLTKLKVPDKEGENYLFGPNAPLRPLSAKIRLGYAIGLYGPRTLADLETIREVRNNFAHTIMPIDFATPEVINVAKRINHLARLTECSGPTAPPTFTDRQKFDVTIIDLGLVFCLMAAHPEGRIPPHILRTIAL